MLSKIFISCNFLLYKQNAVTYDLNMGKSTFKARAYLYILLVERIPCPTNRYTIIFIFGKWIIFLRANKFNSQDRSPQTVMPKFFKYCQKIFLSDKYCQKQKFFLFHKSFIITVFHLTITQIYIYIIFVLNISLI